MYTLGTFSESCHDRTYDRVFTVESSDSYVFVFRSVRDGKEEQRPTYLLIKRYLLFSTCTPIEVLCFRYRLKGEESVYFPVSNLLAQKYTNTEPQPSSRDWYPLESRHY